MSYSSENINDTKRKLIEALGGNRQLYFNNMKNWFRMKMTKEEFDSSARALLPSHLVHLHNEFFLSILTKCQLFGSPISNVHHIKQEDIFDTVPEAMKSRQPVGTPAAAERKKIKAKKKVKATIGNFTMEVRFQPENIYESSPLAILKDPQAIVDIGCEFHAKSLCLLDVGPIKGRLLLGGWEYGLTQVADDAGALLQEATAQFLKTILTCVVSRRRGYRVRDAHFLHSLGVTPPNPWLRNTNSIKDWSANCVGIPVGDEGDNTDHPAWPTGEAADQNAAHSAACTPPTDPPLLPVSCLDLFHALQMHKSTIPNHTVYSLAMERISSRLSHPSGTELEQEVLSQVEVALRESLREQRFATSVT